VQARALCRSRPTVELRQVHCSDTRETTGVSQLRYQRHPHPAPHLSHPRFLSATHRCFCT
jgi:hypothetical protein